MKLIKKTVPLDHNLFLFGDDHEGSILRHKEGWEKLEDMINSEYEGVSANFGVDHGDIIEAITMDDPRYDNKTIKGNVMQEIKQAIKNRQKIKDKLVCILEGNHPLKLWRFGNITEDICTELEVPYGTWSAKITYESVKKKFIYKHFACHGHRSINSSADDPKRKLANMELILKRLMKDKFGDTLLNSMGHTHKLLVCDPTSKLYLVDDGTGIKAKYTKAQSRDETGYINPDHRYFVNTGSFYKLYENEVSGYAERFGYDPVELGFAIAIVRGGELKEVRKVLI